MASIKRAGGLCSVSGWGPALLLLAASAIAAASDANAPREYLDEKTTATVFYVGQPLVFVRKGAVDTRGAGSWNDEHTGGPVAQRGYVTLAAAAVDRMGKYTYVLVGYFWLVGMPEPNQNVCFDREHVVLQLGDRRIELAPFDGSALDAGISEPIHQPSVGNVAPAFYSIDLATLGLIAESAHPVLYCGTGKSQLKYDLFENRLPALRELLQHLRG
jgi:hypothetical protein